MTSLAHAITKGRSTAQAALPPSAALPAHYCAPASVSLALPAAQHKYNSCCAHVLTDAQFRLAVFSLSVVSLLTRNRQLFLYFPRPSCALSLKSPPLFHLPSSLSLILHYRLCHCRLSFVNSLFLTAPARCAFCCLYRAFCSHNRPERAVLEFPLPTQLPLSPTAIMHRTYSMRQSRAPTASQIQVRRARPCLPSSHPLSTPR